MTTRRRRRAVRILVADRVVVPSTRPQQGLGFFTTEDGCVFDFANVTTVQAITKTCDADLLVLNFGCTGTGVLL